jgi:hypothetical protein
MALSTSSAAEQHTHSTGNTFVVDAAKRKTGWAAVPAVPKFLGLTGLIPFFALSPPVMQTGVLDALLMISCNGVLCMAPFISCLCWVQVESCSRASKAVNPLAHSF